MSQTARVKKLETKHASGFSTGWLKYVSVEGHPIEWARDMDHDAVQFMDAGDLRIERHVGEELDAFERRVLAEAHDKLGVTVWFHPSDKFI